MNAIRYTYAVIASAFGSHPDLDFDDCRRLGVAVGTLLRR